MYVAFIRAQTRVLLRCHCVCFVVMSCSSQCSVCGLQPPRCSSFLWPLQFHALVVAERVVVMCWACAKLGPKGKGKGMKPGKCIPKGKQMSPKTRRNALAMLAQRESTLESSPDRAGWSFTVESSPNGAAYGDWAYPYMLARRWNLCYHVKSV